MEGEGGTIGGVGEVGTAQQELIILDVSIFISSNFGILGSAKRGPKISLRAGF